ncbi:hypothetical protein M3Y96_00209600 [Aphelenchoides besseyi]|nr:hypothetical protein M3Y96_00209600 [Aphelenchoides besseyi]
MKRLVAISIVLDSSIVVVDGCRHSIAPMGFKLTMLEVQLLFIFGVLLLLLSFEMGLYFNARKKIYAISCERSRRFHGMYNLQKYTRMQPHIPPSILRRYYESEEAVFDARRPDNQDHSCRVQYVMQRKKKHS